MAMAMGTPKILGNCHEYHGNIMGISILIMGKGLVFDPSPYLLMIVRENLLIIYRKPFVLLLKRRRFEFPFVHVWQKWICIELN
jgi:hypothetical protein